MVRKLWSEENRGENRKGPCGFVGDGRVVRWGDPVHPTRVGWAASDLLE